MPNQPNQPDQPDDPDLPRPVSQPGRTGFRRRTHAEERLAEVDPGPTTLLAQVAELTTERDGLAADVAALTAERDSALAKADEHVAMAQRAQADYANLKRRTAEEREQSLGAANERLLEKVVALADDFDLAIDHVPADARATPWLEGIAAIDRKLRALLESEGVTPIEALGRPFDPAFHEALSHVPGTGRPEDEIVVEIRRGYRLRDRVLRPSLVAVSDGSGPESRPN